MGRLQAGALKRLSIGLSFGGERLIGEGDIDWYPRVEVTARYRVLEENQLWPALVLGYETQGYGYFAVGRYQVKSKGFYLVFSKNYASGLGQFGIHAGANITREDGDDGDWSAWFGLDKSLNDELALIAEYDLARNDDALQARGADEGFLNVGACWGVRDTVAPGVSLTVSSPGATSRRRRNSPFGGRSALGRTTTNVPLSAK